ncbi:MAG: hypothetical protein II992_06810 [Lachnospiraceae bacterium]|nr:hypothetical protein [Lachnospiraceae bacterium]
MNKRVAEQVIRKIAEKQGVSEGELRGEIGKAIIEGYKNPEKSRTWKELFGEKTIPSPEQFILAVGGQFQNLA